MWEIKEHRLPAANDPELEKALVEQAASGRGEAGNTQGKKSVRTEDTQSHCESQNISANRKWQFDLLELILVKFRAATSCWLYLGLLTLYIISFALRLVSSVYSYLCGFADRLRNGGASFFYTAFIGFYRLMSFTNSGGLHRVACD
jgi:hypothetical protein